MVQFSIAFPPMMPLAADLSRYHSITELIWIALRPGCLERPLQTGTEGSDSVCHSGRVQFIASTSHSDNLCTSRSRSYVVGYRMSLCMSLSTV